MKTVPPAWRMILVVLCFQLFLLASCSKETSEHNKKPVVPVSLTPVRSIKIPHKIQTIGLIKAQHTVMITPKTSGYIQQIDFTEGEKIRGNQPLIQLNAAAEQDQLDKSRSDMMLAKINYERNKKLLKHQAISPQTLDTLKAQYKKSLAIYRSSQTDLADKTLVAPFSGVMGSSELNVGDYVKAGSPLLAITDLSHLKVSYTLSAKYIHNVQLGQQVTLRQTQSISPHSTQAKISFISPHIDSATQTFTVHAQFDNQSQWFHPGEYVTVTQPLGSDFLALVVPQSSIVESLSGAWVYVVKNHKAQRLSVKIGGNYQNDTIVTNGLNANDAVITEGVDQIKPGTAVNVMS